MQRKSLFAAVALTGTSLGMPSIGAHSQDAPQTVPAVIRAYQNYDFVPGETIVFADDFTTTQDGEFPSQWDLKAGQAVVNKTAGYETLLLTDGNYARVTPNIKSKTYLADTWTLEFDTYGTPGAYPTVLIFNQGDTESNLAIEGNDATFTCDCNGANVNLTGTYPESLSGDNFKGKWHHIAIAVHSQQMKVYVDQIRALTVPDMHTQPENFTFAGIGNPDTPITFANVRLASGGGMNLIGKKFTDAKIVTHAINFDVDRATIRPESMGALNQIKSIMVADPTLKFEIDGHTDNSGDPAHNQQLSQQRADAVKAQLVSLGVDASRLTAKGYGDTRPVAPNTTPDGKANNRRVEFVRM